MQKKLIIIVILVIGIFILMCLPYIRDIIGNQIGTVPSKNAIERTKEKINELYPNTSIEWIYGDYRNEQGEVNDLCYSSDFVLNNQPDEVISATYCNTGKNVFSKPSYEITIANKKYERKNKLIRRLSQSYTNLISKDIKEDFDDYLQKTNSISVVTPYLDENYAKPLPNNLEYGMKFNKDLPLEWGFQIIIKDYDKSSYDSTIKEIVKRIHNKGYSFEKYHFIFIDKVNNARYIYDLTESDIETKNVDEMMKDESVNSGTYLPYGSQGRYNN